MRLSLKSVTKYVSDNIGKFHAARLEGLKKIKLRQILKRKNPYLFKAKNIVDAHDLVKTLLDAHLSSQEETMFGNFWRGLLFIFVVVFTMGRNLRQKGSILNLKKRTSPILYRSSRPLIGATAVK